MIRRVTIRYKEALCDTLGGEGEYSRKDKLEGHETLFQQMWFGYLKTEKYSVYPGCN